MTFSDLSPSNTITDDDGNTIGVEGSPIITTDQVDLPSRELILVGFNEIIKQLKIINLHLAHLSDQEILPEDVE